MRHQIQRSALQPKHQTVRALENFKSDLIQPARRAPVVRKTFQHQAVLYGPGDKAVRPRTDRRGFLFVIIRRKNVRVHHRREELIAGLGKRDGEYVPVCAEAVYDAECRQLSRGVLALPSAFHGVENIFHLHRIAVMELYAVAQGKHIIQPILGLDHFRCHRGHNISIRVRLDQSLKYVEQNFLGSCRGHIIGVKTVKILRDADADLIGCRPGTCCCRGLIRFRRGLSGVFRGSFRRRRGGCGCCGRCGRCGGCASAACQKQGEHKGKCQNRFLHVFSFHHCPEFPGQCAVSLPDTSDLNCLWNTAFDQRRQTGGIIHES